MKRTFPELATRLTCELLRGPFVLCLFFLRILCNIRKGREKFRFGHYQDAKCNWGRTEWWIQVKSLWFGKKVIIRCPWYEQFYISMRMETRLESNDKPHLNPPDSMKCKNPTSSVATGMWRSFIHQWQESKLKQLFWRGNWHYLQLLVAWACTWPKRFHN